VAQDASDKVPAKDVPEGKQEDVLPERANLPEEETSKDQLDYVKEED